MAGNTFYVIDTSSLIDYNYYYPMSNFESVWKKLDGLILEGRLGAPSQVLKELECKDDEVTSWARKHPALFFEISQYQVEKVKEILGKFKGLIRAAYGLEQADPFVVALACERMYGPQKDLFQHEVCVVTRSRCMVIGREYL
ncbi:DUF4411 family protein [Methanocella conradii]|uniref:DUF4411 family protein n=1 Tax=Methanocella conradii TaxID=1175444 RepID=UPI0009D962D1|nr:DUF4411 family protein [Methanocella conradii]